MKHVYSPRLMLHATRTCILNCEPQLTDCVGNAEQHKHE